MIDVHYEYISVNQFVGMGVGDVYDSFGWRTVIIPAFAQQYRFPRSKRRRMQKKWAKKASNWKNHTGIHIDAERRIIYCSADKERELRQRINATRRVPITGA